MQVTLQRRLGDFDFTGLPEPERYFFSRQTSLLERLKIFYYAITNPVICPDDEQAVRPTGRIIIESQITDPRHGSYKGFKSVEGECENCCDRYSIAGMSCISSTSREDLQHKESLLFHVDAVLGLMPVGGRPRSL